MGSPGPPHSGEILLVTKVRQAEQSYGSLNMKMIGIQYTTND